MEQRYVARLEFLCPRGFGVQVSAGLYAKYQHVLYPLLSFP